MSEQDIFVELSQYGALGIVCAVLLVLVVWLTRKMMHELSESRTCIANNTNATISLEKSNDKNTELLNKVLERILARPCVKE